MKSSTEPFSAAVNSSYQSTEERGFGQEEAVSNMVRSPIEWSSCSQAAFLFVDKGQQACNSHHFDCIFDARNTNWILAQFKRSIVHNNHWNCAQSVCCTGSNFRFCWLPHLWHGHLTTVCCHQQNLMTHFDRSIP